MLRSLNQLRLGAAGFVFVLTILMAGGCSEYIPFSGGQLSGNLTPPPLEWSSLAQSDIIQLETELDTPYSVKLWIIGIGPVAYVHAGANRAKWVSHIDENPNVRLLVGKALYELKAQRVEAQEEFDNFSDAYEQKYGNRPSNENVQEAYLYRLVKRG